MPHYLDQLLILADPKQSDPYTCLIAYQALRKAHQLTPTQYQALQNLNTKPAKGTPPRVTKYPQRGKDLLLKEFQNKIIPQR